MKIRANKLREALKNGRPSLGTRVESTWPYITEIASSSGLFDYVEFEGEYAVYDQADLENICRAAELGGCSTVVKIDRQNSAFMAQKAIASGANGILIADLYTADEVRDFIYSITPSSPNGGIFGRPSRRLGMNGSGSMTMADYVKMVNDVVVMVMVEKEETMKNLREICQIPRVDMIIFGPWDYSMNVGWEPQRDKEKILEVHKEMIRICQENNVEPCVQVDSASEIPPYRELGVKHFNVGDEVCMLMDYYALEGKAARKMLDM